MQSDQSLLTISVMWRGKKFILDINSSAALKEFGEELQKLTNVKAETMRLIVPQSSSEGPKLLSPFSDEQSHLSLLEISIPQGKAVRMMGVPEVEAEEVLQNAKANLRIAGFDEEEKRLRQRMSNRPHAALRLPQGTYIFCNFRTLQIPGVELNPPASEALKRMHMLAADPGIVAIMNKHRWRVGIMTEMAPVGYVGVSPKCILGFNKNHGEEISLRLRTDDLKGFRKYERIKATLLHELAHMVHSEHDANFHALEKQLNEEAATLDWTKSRSQTLSGVQHSEHHEEFYFEESSNLSHKLGGKTSDQLSSARASSIAAAHHRLNASINNFSPGELHNEPDTKDYGFDMHEESGPKYSLKEGKLVIEDPNNAGYEPEPDLDDSSSNQNEFEPDPDDLGGSDVMESEPDSGINASKITSEPNFIDIEMTQYASLTTDEKLASAKICEEPDPDDSLKYDQHNLDHAQVTETLDITTQTRKTSDKPDSDDFEAQQNGFVHENIMRQNADHSVANETMEDLTQPSKTCAEPDPDDCQASGVVQAEPDPDDNLLPLMGLPGLKTDVHDTELKRIQDPVTVVCNRLQKAIEMLQMEVNPRDITTVLQTLFKIIRNLIEHPEEMKFKRLRMANPIFQRNVANYKAAVEILSLIGFIEDVVFDEIGKVEPYLVLKRNDPGLLWLAKSSIETCIAH
ncbi:uncharacterized protein LOC131147957 [Malania oleifera]|uniref:uncharacterized protein LOC131147957 n=1 Tax=Malania oleifera TaxID=397392 RepID=UPI0025AE2FB6|nr:uncharacterized protein LOC131147957 [Malania oleifera]